jgi:hypothetical protein
MSGTGATVNEMFIKEIPAVDEPNETLALLNQDERLRIQAEEIYRHEVKARFEGQEKTKTWRDKLWIFLNSGLGLWFLSTCIVGGITYWYAERQEAEKHRIEVAANIEKQEIEKKQKELEKARYNASLVIVLLPHLASPENKQNQLAIAVTHYLKEKGELPGELESVLAEIVKGGNMPNSSPSDQAKVNAAAAVIDIPQKSELDNRSDLTSLPPRVYMQIPTQAQREMAQSLQSKLRASGFLVPGIENVENKATSPKQTEVRFYRDEDRSEALQVIRILTEAGQQPNSEPQKIPGGGKGTRPRHYEVWISKS